MAILIIMLPVILGIIFHIIIEEYCEDDNISYSDFCSSEIEFEKTLENINESEKNIPKCDCDASEWTLDEIMAREG